MKTRIIVDSTADLTPEYKERVHTVPLTVLFGEEEYIDGVLTVCGDGERRGDRCRHPRGADGALHGL